MQFRAQAWKKHGQKDYRGKIRTFGQPCTLGLPAVRPYIRRSCQTLLSQTLIFPILEPTFDHLMAQISDILRDISSVWGPKKSDIANCPSPQLSGVLFGLADLYGYQHAPASPVPRLESDPALQLARGVLR